MRTTSCTCPYSGGEVDAGTSLTQTTNPLAAVSTLSASIPVEELWKLFDYSPLTGKLWSKRYSRPIQGCKKKGALRIPIRWNGKVIHTNYGRVVYAWCTGAWPIQDVDHVNQDFTDNRIQNLRDVDRRRNIQNKKTFQGGAHFNKAAKKWRSKILINGKQIHLGTFKTQAEAQAAYAAALSELVS